VQEERNLWRKLGAQGFDDVPDPIRFRRRGDPADLPSRRVYGFNREDGIGAFHGRAISCGPGRSPYNFLLGELLGRPLEVARDGAADHFLDGFPPGRGNLRGRVILGGGKRDGHGGDAAPAWIDARTAAAVGFLHQRPPIKTI